MSVLTFDQGYELIGACGVIRVAFLAVKCKAHGLTAYNLACGCYKGYQTGIAANLGNQFHCVVKQIRCLKSLELSHHIGVHTSGNLGVFHEFIGLREAEVLFNGVTVFEQTLFVICTGTCYGLVKVC